mgnify:FL=1
MNTPTFDPNFWANKNNKNTGTTNKDAVPTPHSAATDEAANAAAVAAELTSRHIDITQGYDNWLRLGFALADGIGEEGRQIFHDLSRQNADYNHEECDKQFSYCLKSHGQGITIASFYKMAQDAGVDILNTFKKNRKDFFGGDFANLPICHQWQKNNKFHNSLKINNSNNSGQSWQNWQNWQNLEKSNNSEKNRTILEGETFCGSFDHFEWCEFLRPIVECMDDDEGSDKILLGTLAILSGMIPNLYGCYGGHVVYPPLYFIFYGPAASRKGEIQACLQVLKPLKTEVRRGYEAELARYREEHSEWEAKGGRSPKRAERGPEPKEPKYRSPQIPANSSASAAYLALEANGGSGIMFETEADVLSQSLLSDYGDYSAGLRAAFHHEPIQMNRVRDNLHVEIEEPRLAVCLTCTPGQLPKLFPSFENGLGSRFLFYGLTRRVEWRNPFTRQDKTLDEVMADAGKEALELFHLMNNLGSQRIQFVLKDNQQQLFNQFFSDTLSEQFYMLGDGITSFVFRMGLSAFRIAMILSILRKFSERPFGAPLFQKGEQVLMCSDQDFNITLKIMDTLVNHTARIFSALVDEESMEMPAGVYSLKEEEKRLYNWLDTEFTFQNIQEYAKDRNIGERTVNRYVKHFIDHHLAVRVKHGQYRKTGSGSAAADNSTQNI